MDSRRMDMSLRKLQEMVRARETWPAAAHGVTKSQTRPSNRTTRKMARWTHLKGRTQRNTCAYGAGEREGRDQLRERWHKGTAVLKTARWRAAAANTGSAQRSATACTGGRDAARAEAQREGDTRALPADSHCTTEANTASQGNLSSN